MSSIITKATDDYIKSLWNADWFSTIGLPLPSDAEIVSVEDHKEWLTKRGAEKWYEKVLHDAWNGLMGVLDRDHTERFQDWSENVREISKRLEGLPEHVVARAPKELPKSPNVKKAIMRACRLACMEHQYADLIAPGFFRWIGDWYLEGRFPCGLTADYPDGELVIL